MAKKIIIAIAGIIVIFVVLIVVVVWNINPILEGFRPQITQLASDAVKQPVELGEIKLRLFPSIAIEVSNVGLRGSNKNAESGAHIKTMMLDTELLPLLSKKLSVTELSLSDARIVITREKNGSINLGGVPLKAGKPEHQAIQAPQATTEQPTSPKVTQTTPTTAANEKPKADGPLTEDKALKPEVGSEKEEHKISLQIKNAKLSNAFVIWDDKLVNPPQRVELGDINASLSDITQTGVGKFSVAASIISTVKNNLGIEGNVKKVEKSLVPDADLVFSLKSLDLGKVSSLMSAYGVKVKDLSVSDQASLQLSAKTSSGKISVNSTFDGKDANIAFGEIFKKTKGTPMSLAAVMHPTLFGEIDAEKLEITLGDIRLDSPFKVNGLTKSGKGSLKTIKFPLASLETFLPPVAPLKLRGDIEIQLDANLLPGALESKSIPELGGYVEFKNIAANLPVGLSADKPGATSSAIPLADLNGKVAFEKDAINAKSISWTLAQQKFELTTTVSSPKTPEIQFRLLSPKLQFGPILQATKPGGIPALNDSSANNLQISGAFSSSSRNGNVALTLDQAQLAGFPLEASKLSLDYTLDPNNKPLNAKLHPSTFNIFGGSISVQGELNSEQTLNIGLKGGKFDLKRVIEVVSPTSKYILNGAVESVTTQLQGQMARFAQTASGPLNLLILNGSVEGVNILKATIGGLAEIPGIGAVVTGAVPEKFRQILAGDTTPFNKLSLNGTLGNEAMHIGSLNLEHELYILSGQGTLGFAGSADLKTQFKLTPAVTTAMVTREPKLKLLLDADQNLVVPLLISRKDGSFRVLPDTSTLAKNAARNTAKEAATKTLEKVAPGIGNVAPGIGKAIDSLFK